MRLALRLGGLAVALILVVLLLSGCNISGQHDDWDTGDEFEDGGRGAGFPEGASPLTPNERFANTERGARNMKISEGGS